MRRTMRVAALGATLTAALLVPAAAASAAPFERKLDTSSVNGGDQGFGNCGRNASGGRTVDPLAGAAGNGYGGFKPGDTCVEVEDVVVVVDADGTR